MDTKWQAVVRLKTLGITDRFHDYIEPTNKEKHIKWALNRATSFTNAQPAGGLWIDWLTDCGSGDVTIEVWDDNRPDDTTPVMKISIVPFRYR